MKQEKLSKNELDIMCVLWESRKPLLASEIVTYNDSLRLPTVQRLLKKLVKNDYIEIADIVQTGKSLARRYCAKKTADDYIKCEIEYFFPIVKDKISLSKTIITSFFNADEGNQTLVEELEELIEMEKGKLDHD